MSSFTRPILILIAALTAAVPLHGQSTISGRVLDVNNKPVADVEVLLHAITESSGSQVDQDTSRADGGFDLRVATVDPKSIYFVAVTYQSQLFMGDMLRPPFPAGQEYIVRVGVNPVDFSGGPATAPSTAPVQQGSSRTAGAVVIAVAILVIAGIAVIALRRRPPEYRRVLVELARVEDEISSRTGPDPTLEKRRSELRNRLLDSTTD